MSLFHIMIVYCHHPESPIPSKQPPKNSLSNKKTFSKHLDTALIPYHEQSVSMASSSSYGAQIEVLTRESFSLAGPISTVVKVLLDSNSLHARNYPSTGQGGGCASLALRQNVKGCFCSYLRASFAGV